MPQDESTDELSDLLSRTALGDRSAFARLYRRTSAQLLGIVLRIQRDRAAAEDVLQEVFVNVWRAASGYDAQVSRPMTWLASVARNRAIDSLRRAQAQPRTESATRGDDEDDGPDLLEGVASDDPGPVEWADDRDRARAVRQCMQGLSGEQQQSLSLAFYQGLSHAEVAEHLRQPLGTVKSWVRRGLMALKACLERCGMALEA